MLHFDYNEIISVTLILFAIIDIIGSLPVLINIDKEMGPIEPGRAALVSGGLMIAFLFIGDTLLKVIGIDVNSFAAAGAIVLFFISLEMILGIRLFREKNNGKQAGRATTIVPVSFPLIAGAGTLTTILTIKADYHTLNIIIGILINILIIYLVLLFKKRISRRISPAGLIIIRRVFGIVLLAAAIKIFKIYALGVTP